MSAKVIPLPTACAEPPVQKRGKGPMGKKVVSSQRLSNLRWSRKNDAGRAKKGLMSYPAIREAVARNEEALRQVEERAAVLKSEIRYLLERA